MKTILRTSILVFGLLLVAAGTASADTGSWSVSPAPGGGFTATWTAPEPLPVTSDRPEILLDGQPAGPTTLSPDGASLTATVPGDIPPATDRLSVTLSGRSLDRPEPLAGTSGSPWIAAAGAIPDLAYDPGRRGPEQIESFDYNRPPYRFGRMRKLEMKGHVVTPSNPVVAANGPLVVFLHGRHSSCYRAGKDPWLGGNWPCRPGTKPVPSYLGYDYLQRILASQGFVTVSIAANGINGQDDRAQDGGANARADLVRRHLDLWADWVGAATHHADLGRVILIGHSRGGEGVNRASEVIPASAPYHVAGQILLAPTDFARQSAAFIPTVTVLPYCDGDVSDLQGQEYTDNSIHLAAGDSSLKSSVVVFGANHNFFNTEWTPGQSRAASTDDTFAPAKSLCGKKGRTRLTPVRQQRVARSYVAGAIQLMTGTDPRPIALLDGSRVRVGPDRKAEVISQSVGGGKLTLVAGQDAQLPAGSRPPGPFTCRGYSGDLVRDCARYVDSQYTPHWPSSSPFGLPTRPALAMEWRTPGRTARLALAQELDLTGMDSLDLRVVVDPRTRVARLGVSLKDALGNVIDLVPPNGGRVNGMPMDRGRSPAMPGRWLARTLRVPVPAVSPGSFDLGRVTSIRFTGRSKPACGSGCPKVSRIRVLDVSARPPGPLPLPPSDRLPLVRLGSVKKPEGGPGRHTVEVPFTVSGTVTDPDTRFRVIAVGNSGIDPMEPITVPITPGQTSGTIPVPYRGNNAFDRTREIYVTAYPIRGAIPATSNAMIRLKDDDPEPRLKVRVMARTVRSGQPVRWQVSLSGPVGWPVTLDARFSAAPGLPQLRLGDLSPRWIDKRVFVSPKTGAGTPLSQTGAWISLGMLSAKRPFTVRIPTRRFTGGPTRGVRLRLGVSGFGTLQTPAVRVLPR